MGRPTIDEESLAAMARDLAGSSPQAILKWAVELFGSKLTMATAFGAEGCCLIHMLAEIEPQRPASSIWTPATSSPRRWNCANASQERYGIEVEYGPAGIDGRGVRERSTAARSIGTGPTSAATIARSCRCAGRLPATTPGSAPFAAIRPDHRGQAGIVQWDAKFGLVKVNPLLHWTRKDVWNSSCKTMSRITRCTTRAIRASAAGRARGRLPASR